MAFQPQEETLRLHLKTIQSLNQLRHLLFHNAQPNQNGMLHCVQAADLLEYSCSTVLMMIAQTDQSSLSGFRQILAQVYVLKRMILASTTNSTHLWTIVKMDSTHAKSDSLDSRLWFIKMSTKISSLLVPHHRRCNSCCMVKLEVQVLWLQSSIQMQEHT